MCVVNNEVTSMLILALPEPLANRSPFSLIWDFHNGTNLICNDDHEFFDQPKRVQSPHL